MAFCCLVAGLLAAGRGPAQTVDECVKAALTDNPDLQLAASRVAAAAAGIRLAQSAYYPQLGVQAGATYTNNPGQALFMQLNQRQLDMTQDLNSPDARDNYRGALVAKYLLTDFGRRALQTEVAKLGSEAAAQMQAAVLNELVFQVVRSYYAVLQARAFIQVHEQTATSLTENLRVARERVAAKSALPTDALNLEVRLAEAQESLIASRNGLRLALATLNTAIGRELATEKGLPAAVPAPPAAAAGSADPEPRVIESRAEMRALRTRLTAAAKEVERARRDYLPRVSAFGESDLDSDVPGGTYRNSYYAGIVLEWDVFTGGRRAAQTAATRASHAALQAEERMLRGQLALDLKQTAVRLADAHERFAVTSKSQASATEALRITHERYQKGEVGITELLNAEVALATTRARGVAAHFECLIAAADLARARGELGPQAQAATVEGAQTK